MCYGYYREKDAESKESTTWQMKVQVEKTSPEAAVAATRQAEEKAVARFLARIRQMVARETQQSEESTG